MLMLVGDIGATQSRLALAQGNALVPGSLRRFITADFTGPEDLLARAFSPDIRPRAICLAVAGPVIAGRASLTNGSWHFDPPAICRATGAARCLLVNDLAALGRAIPEIPPGGVRWLTAPPKRANGQALVVGIGTGMNACAIARAANGRVHCIASEAGHAALPAPVSAMIAEAAPGEPFPSAEALFSGAGLSRLHAAMGGGALMPAQIASAYGTDARATATLHLFARALGRNLVDLSLLFLPQEGVFLAGSVARGLIDAGLGADVLAGLQAGTSAVASPPVGLITDDAAALHGCLLTLADAP